MVSNIKKMDSNNKFKLYLPAIADENNNNISLIAADVRGELTCFAHYTTENQNLVLRAEKEYKTGEFSSFEAIAERFIGEFSLSGIAKLAVAVPGPVISRTSAPQRLSFALNADEISRHLNIPQVYLINDLEASAYGLGNDDEQCFHTIHYTQNVVPGNIAVLAPGAGLGEAGLFWDGQYMRPFATEGGHCEFSPRTSDEVEFYQFLHKIYGIVTWESVLSHDGLFNIYRFLRDVKQQKQPDWLTKEIEAGNFSKAIIEGALQSRDRICNMTIDTFMIFLAREANSLVLKLKATGGLFISGDIPVMLQTYLNKEKFYRNFIVSDKMDDLLRDVPIYLVKDQKTIIQGAALYAAFSGE